MYDGPTLLDHLEAVHVGDARNLDDARFPVQFVIRPQREEFHDYRGYAGQVASGRFRPADEVVVLPSGKRVGHAAARGRPRHLPRGHARLPRPPARGEPRVRGPRDLDLAGGGAQHVVRWRLDVNTHERDQDTGELGLNAIGRVSLRASAPLAFDPYSHNRATGSFILIDEATNETVGAGMVREHDAPPVRWLRAPWGSGRSREIG